MPKQPYTYSLKFPEHVAQNTREFDSDLITLGGAFYDKNLFKDRTISCASCRKQNIAFSDDLAFSKGVRDQRTSRNSIAMGSVLNFQVYYGQGGVPFFWDNRASDVKTQITQTMTNSEEMDMPLELAVERVKAALYYSPLFQSKFGDTQITENRILDALAEFVNSIGSFYSRYDQALDEFISGYLNLNHIDHRDLPNFSDA